MLKKNRVLRTHFFFPCIKTEVHAPVFMNLLRKFYFGVLSSKHKIEI